MVHRCMIKLVVIWLRILVGILVGVCITHCLGIEMHTRTNKETTNTVYAATSPLI